MKTKNGEMSLAPEHALRCFRDGSGVSPTGSILSPKKPYVQNCARQQAGKAPCYLELEIAESGVMHNVEESMSALGARADRAKDALLAPLESKAASEVAG